MTVSRHFEALVASADELSGSSAWAQVLDFKDLQLLMTAEQMAQNVIAASELVGPVHLPAAIIFAPEQLGHWQAYSRLMADRGVLRGLFTGPNANQQALAWAHRMGQFGRLMRRPPQQQTQSHLSGGRILLPVSRL